MNNKEIALILYQIAKILELKDGGNRFRTIAYERASQEIENNPEEMSEIYKKGGLEALEEVPNIGESIAGKIEELLKTGRLKYFEELQSNLPRAEVEFLKIPGIGPKTAEKLSKDLKAESIEDLELKLKTGKADKLFKEKTRNNILRGIEIMRNLTGRMLITDALPIAKEVVEAIKKMPGVKKVDYVGSLRRMKETIGDIDIVATTDKPVEVISQFVKLPEVDHIISQGEAKSTIIHRRGAQIDLEIVPQDEYGSLLQHFTGSKDHNVSLRSYALTKGMSVSEHGVKAGDKLNRFSEEKGVYEFLGMDWIPPELRENAGEIQAALNRKLPKLIELKDIKGDLHVHSRWSDGNMKITEIVEAAEKLNYEYIVISDHTVGLGIANGLDEKALEERQLEISRVQKKSKVRILSSVEVNIKADATLDIEPWMLKKLDIVTASVHSAFNQDKETMTNRIVRAIKDPNVDIIGHPSGRIIGQREPYEVDWQRIFRACVENNTALEISAFPNRLDLRDLLVREAKGFGVKFAINTDAHRLSHLDLMTYGVSVARRGWLIKTDVINTQSLEDILKWIAGK